MTDCACTVTCRTKIFLALDNVVRVNRQILFPRDTAPAIALASLGRDAHRGRASLAHAAIKDHVDAGIVLKALPEMRVEPYMLARDDEEMPQHARILR